MKVRVTASPRPEVVVPPAERPQVSFVAVTYGTGSVVLDSLAAIAASLAPSLAWEYVVVDNAHPTLPGHSRRLLALGTSGVRLVEPGENLGFGGGCNAGLAVARADVAVLINPDVFPLPGWYEPLAAALDDPTVAIAAPVLLDPDGSVQEAGSRINRRGDPIPHTEAPEPGAISTVMFASAACWMVRRAEILDAGGFDPAYHPAYFEDADLAMRLAAAGRRTVVAGSSRVTHLVHMSTPSHGHPESSRQRAEFLRRWSPHLPDTAG